MRVEVAIRALADAIWDMNIEGKGFVSIVHVLVILLVKANQRQHLWDRMLVFRGWRPEIGSETLDVGTRHDMPLQPESVPIIQYF